MRRLYGERHSCTFAQKAQYVLIKRTYLQLCGDPKYDFRYMPQLSHIGLSGQHFISPKLRLSLTATPRPLGAAPCRGGYFQAADGSKAADWEQPARIGKLNSGRGLGKGLRFGAPGGILEALGRSGGHADDDADDDDHYDGNPLSHPSAPPIPQKENNSSVQVFYIHTYLYICIYVYMYIQGQAGFLSSTGPKKRAETTGGSKRTPAPERLPELQNDRK